MVRARCGCTPDCDASLSHNSGKQLIPLLDDNKDAVRVRAAAAYIRLQHSAKVLPAKRVTLSP